MYPVGFRSMGIIMNTNLDKKLDHYGPERVLVDIEVTSPSDKNLYLLLTTNG